MKSALRVLAIVAASLLVILAARPLATTEWADAVRAERGAHEEQRRSSRPRTDDDKAPASQGEAAAHEPQPERRRRGPPRALRYVLPFVKETILMGVPAIITLLVLRVIRWVRRRAAATS